MSKQATDIAMALKQLVEESLIKPKPVLETPKEQQYLTYQDLADKIGVSKQTVYRWVKAGTVRAVRFSARVVVIPASELDRLLAWHFT